MVSAGSLSVGSGEDLGDLSSDFGSLGEPTPVSQRRRGTQNAGFEADDIEDTLSAADETEEDCDLASTTKRTPNGLNGSHVVHDVDIANVHLQGSPPPTRVAEAIS